MFYAHSKFCITCACTVDRIIGKVLFYLSLKTLTYEKNIFFTFHSCNNIDIISD